MISDDKINILVVDDLPEKLLAMQVILESLGQNVVTALSGREALRWLLEQDFAVILLDVNMPDMDGFETAALIRRRKKTAHTPIIFVTAYSDEMHTARGYALGAVDYILSPIVPEILRTKVGVFVELYRKSEQVKRQAEERVALAQEQAARAAAEEATRRSTFLAQASTVLASSLDYDATRRGLLDLVVPSLADLCALILPDEQGQTWQTELAWVDQVGVPTTRAVMDRQGLGATLAVAVERVLVAGKSEVLPNVGTRLAVTQAKQAGAGGSGPVGLDFEAKAAVIIPLLARGKTLGALVLAQGPSDRLYSPADLTLAEDLANRAAVSIDNARLYRDIQEGDRRKNEFLAMLAHELRNPLAPIRNALQILRMRGFDQPDLVWAMEVMERQMQQLVRMVDDLLDVSRITRGKINLQKELGDVASLVHRAVEISRPLLDERKHELTVSLPAQPLFVDVDSARMAQALANLLNNAAKYTDEGGQVWLTVEQDGGEVVFRVRDSGMGIPADLLSSVFDLFTQADRSLDRSQGGLGIGLTLVRRLVELHGGSVRAFSAGSGQGSEFVVRLPRVTAEPSEESSGNGFPTPERMGSLCRILIVDDNVDSAESLGLLLSVSGHEIQTAHDGATALATARTFQPEVVLLDIGLPRMDGYEVARRLREEPGLEDVVLVALTGYGQEEDRRRSLEAGFNHHFVKPVDTQALEDLFARR